MAYIEGIGEEEEGGMSQQSAPATIESGMAPTPAPSAGGTESGMFSNIQKYVEANKPQAQGMATGVVGGFKGKAEDISKAAQQKGTAFQEGTIAGESAKIKTAAERAQDVVSKAGTKGYLAADIAGMQDITDFRTGRLASQVEQIQGPDYQSEQLKSQQLAKAGQGGGSFANLQSYLGGGKDYTRGQSNLDQAILGGSQAATQKMRTGVSDVTRGLSQDVRAQQAASREALTGLGTQARGVQESIVGGAQTREQEIQKQLDERIKAEDIRRQNIQKAVAEAYDPSKIITARTGTGPEFDVGRYTDGQFQDLSGGRLSADRAEYLVGGASKLKITPELAQKYGVSEEDIYRSLGIQDPVADYRKLRTFGYDPENILQAAGTTSQQVATEEDYQKAAALSALAGRSPEEGIVQSGYGEGDVFGNLSESDAARRAAFEGYKARQIASRTMGQQQYGDWLESNVWSDKRTKTNIKESSTKEALQNLINKYNKTGEE